MFDPEERETNYFTDLQIMAEDLGVGPEGAEILAKMDLPTRRRFLTYATAALVGVFAIPGSSRAERVSALESWARSNVPLAAPGQEETITLRLVVNGAEKSVAVDPRTVLLDALRERMGMTGTKKGCDHGQCGACTVLVDGRRVLSCLTLAAQVEGQQITTIEGLAQGDSLHPLQEAFIKHDAYQCGYCTPGQICSAVGMLSEAKQGTASYVTRDVRKAVTVLSDDEIRERMSGNICRCGAYPKIVSAIHEAHSGKLAKQTWAFHTDEEISNDTV
jgi:xanthine dehydrogenase YagT iron-sulfur-binding subunit